MYVFAGYSLAGRTSKVYAYNTTANTWTQGNYYLEISEIGK